LDERNLAHYLSALALAAFTQRIEGPAPESRRCWWPSSGPGQFAIQTELPRDEFRSMLFAKAHRFLSEMIWHPGLGGASSGLVTSGDEIGVNPFIALSGEAENTPLKVFAGRVLPSKTLPDQQGKLVLPNNHQDWLTQFGVGAGSWGFDYRVNQHASDKGSSSDAEGTGQLDPFYPAIELLSFAAAAFFVPAHAWPPQVDERQKKQRIEKSALQAFVWTQPTLLTMITLAATGRIFGLPARCYKFSYRPAGHGDAAKYKFFPPATIQPSSL
jgi:hypothetical protein